MTELTPKQQMFVQEYLIDLNGTQAAIRAGYSPDTACVIGSENLRKPYIAEAIQKAQQERCERTGITQDKVLAEYAKLGFANIQNFITWNNQSVVIIPSTEMSADDAACISEITQTTGEGGSMVKVKLHDKKGALDSLARAMGMFKDKIDVDLTLNDAVTAESIVCKLFGNSAESGSNGTSE